MIVYWLLLLPTAAIAYAMGSLDTMVLASNFVFRRSLRRLGRGNAWLSNFRRVYGIGGFIRLFLVELVRDIVPILIGGLLLGIKEHADVGRVFAGLCLVLGRLYPIYYGFSGSHATLCLVAAGFFLDTSVGAAALIMAAAGLWLTRYLSVSTVFAAVTCAVVSVMVLEDQLMIRLAIIMSVLVLIKHVPALMRVFSGREQKLSFEEDITYKLDDRF